MSLMDITPENFRMSLKDVAEDLQVNVWVSPKRQDSVGAYRYSDKLQYNYRKALEEALSSYEGYEVPAIEIRRIIKKIFGKLLSVRREHATFTKGYNIKAYYVIRAYGSDYWEDFDVPGEPEYSVQSIRIAIEYKDKAPYTGYRF